MLSLADDAMLGKLEPERLKAMIEALANREKQQATLLDAQLDNHHNNLTNLINDTPPPQHRNQTTTTQPTRTADDDTPPSTESDDEDDADAHALEASSSHLSRVLDQPRWQH